MEKVKVEAVACNHDGEKAVGYDEVTCKKCGWIKPSGTIVGVHDGWFPSHTSHKEFLKYGTYQGMDSINPIDRTKPTPKPARVAETYCTHCGGSGEAIYTVGAGDEGYDQLMTCQDCNGTGDIVEQVKNIKKANADCGIKLLQLTGVQYLGVDRLAELEAKLKLARDRIDNVIHTTALDDEAYDDLCGLLNQLGDENTKCYQPNQPTLASS